MRRACSQHTITPSAWVRRWETQRAGANLGRLTPANLKSFGQGALPGLWPAHDEGRGAQRHVQGHSGHCGSKQGQPHCPARVLDLHDQLWEREGRPKSFEGKPSVTKGGAVPGPDSGTSRLLRLPREALHGHKGCELPTAFDYVEWTHLLFVSWSSAPRLAWPSLLTLLLTCCLSSHLCALQKNTPRQWYFPT